jgi:hypothetical protein
LSSPAEAENPNLKELRQLFEKGRLNEALSLGKGLEKAKPEIRKEADYALLFAQVLIEAEAPSSHVKALLMEALVENESPLLHDYLDVINAKGQLNHEAEDAGEVLLKAVIRRSPKNAHANFLLGSHLFWVEKQNGRALKYLEAAVKARPTFLRALACLGALYQALGNGPVAAHSFEKCAELENEPGMKKFFEDLAAKAGVRG